MFHFSCHRIRKHVDDYRVDTVDADRRNLDKNSEFFGWTFVSWQEKRALNLGCCTENSQMPVLYFTTVSDFSPGKAMGMTFKFLTNFRQRPDL